MSRPQTVNAWQDYIQGLHSRTIELGLERVQAVWARIDQATSCRIIAVAGTNGKGSSVAMLEAIYRQAGYKTGAYTSPHLVSYNERVRIDRQPVSDQTLLDAFDVVEAGRDNIPLTFFEFGTLVALTIFQSQRVDVMLLEVGMGGRLDAVNIMPNDLALITAIGLDHTAWLGNDREAIGSEKAGIIKKRGTAVCSDPQPPVSISTIAKRQDATLIQLGQDYDYVDQGATWKLVAADKTLDGLSKPAWGSYQLQNAAGVLAAVNALKPVLSVSEASIRLGLADVHLLARQQLIPGKPTLLLDVSHNQESVAPLVKRLQSLCKKNVRIHAVFGALQDKSLHTVIAPMAALIDTWHLVSLEGERGQSGEELKHHMLSVVVQEKLAISDEVMATYSSPEVGYRAAVAIADDQDIVLIFGSFRTVGAIIPLVLNSE